MTTSHETPNSPVSDDEREKTERYVELDDVATHDSLSYESGRDLALQANNLYDLKERKKNHKENLLQASTILWRDSGIHDKPGSQYGSDRFDNPEVGPRLERAVREHAEADLAFKAVSEVAGSMLTYDEDLQERAKTKPSE